MQLRLDRIYHVNKISTMEKNTDVKDSQKKKIKRSKKFYFRNQR